MTRLTVLYHNVLHWSNRRHELCNEYSSHDPDIILLASHGQADTSKIKIQHYKCYQRNKTGVRADGVAIAIKRNLPHKILDDFDQEFLAVEVDTTKGPVVFATCYLPPRRPYLPYPDLLYLLSLRKPVYLLADMNARHGVLGYNDRNNVGNGLASLMTDGRLVHLGPDFPTFISRASATTPDVVLANRYGHLNTYISPGNLTSSDHLPIKMVVSTSPILVPTAPSPCYKRANWESFKLVLEAKPSVELNGRPRDDIDRETERWMNDILEARRLCIPERYLRVIPHPITSPELQQLQAMYCGVKDLAARRGWDAELRNRYMELRQQLPEVSRALFNSKWAELTTELANSCQEEPTVFWRKLRRMMGSTAESSSYMFNHAGVKVHTDAEKEAVHRSFWKNIYRISEADNDLFDEDTEEMVMEALEEGSERLTPAVNIDFGQLNSDDPIITPITEADVLRIISKMKNKSPGSSKIRKPEMVNLPPVMVSRLVHIFNASLACGYFPQVFKAAILTLIPKAGKPPNRPENFRPISLLEVPGKIFEKVINLRLRTHLETNSLLNERQFGFRQARGTATAIAVAYEQIALALANRQKANIILRDVAKAFDKTWYSGLRYRILQLQIPSAFSRLLSSFLDGRTARVKVGNLIGEAFALQCGVPQGSGISPTLYILYTSPTPPPTRNSDYIMYADDVTQVVTHPSPRRFFLELATDRAIGAINNFENEWKIKTNLNKFVVIPAARTRPGELNLDSANVNYTKEGKLLGLAFTSTGIGKHVKQRQGQGYNVLRKLRRFSGLPESTKVFLYKTLIRPVLEYPPVPLNALAPTNILRLQAVQNMSLIWATGTRWPDPRPGVFNPRPAGRMRPADPFCAAPEHILNFNKFDELLPLKITSPLDFGSTTILTDISGT